MPNPSLNTIDFHVTEINNKINITRPIHILLQTGHDQPMKGRSDKTVFFLKRDAERSVDFKPGGITHMYMILGNSSQFGFWLFM